MRFRCELLVLLLLCTIVQVHLELLQTDAPAQDTQLVDQRRSRKISERLAAEQQEPGLSPGSEEEILQDVLGEGEAIHNRQRRAAESKSKPKPKKPVKTRRRSTSRKPDSKQKAESNAGQKAAPEKKSEPRVHPFPYWIFMTLIPLVFTLMVFIGCFVFYKRAYNKAIKESWQEIEKKRKEQKKKRRKDEDERGAAGLPMSAMDMEAPGSDYAGFGTEFNIPKIKEGGLGSIMRDPDLDSAAREEAPRIYKMVYSGNKWRTVDKVPSNMSFEIPSESM
ncbi:hypothetical protein Y032_0039g59 [Ancylostoma ceylanicum]|uniref:Uncharacterized protein n=1 Tax=Ancylostoma ceylanicum TaxID=53326 RepID=A0A016UJ50_9BILA|nr:hypothetical protein Y032_0039g59 [Ancylostoma ceylanicum]